MDSQNSTRREITAWVGRKERQLVLRCYQGPGSDNSTSMRPNCMGRAASSTSQIDQTGRLGSAYLLKFQDQLGLSVRHLLTLARPAFRNA